MKSIFIAAVFCSVNVFAADRVWNFSPEKSEITRTQNLGCVKEAAGPFTFEIDITPLACQKPKGEGMVCSWGNGYDNGWRLVLKPAGTAYHASITFGNTASQRRSVRFVGLFATNELARLAVAFDGSKVALYRDGVLNAFADIQAVAPARPASLAVGGERYGIAFYPFKVGRIKITSDVYSPETIASSYEKAVPEESWSEAYRRAKADVSFRMGDYAQAVKQYAWLYEKLCSDNSLRRAEVAFAYADALAASGKKEDAIPVLEKIAGAKDLPPYLTREAANKAGMAIPSPERPIPTADDFRPSEKTDCVFFVSVAGDDNNEGSSSRPLATINGALARLREYRKDNPWPKGGAQIALRAGRYEIKDSIEIFNGDAGLENAPLKIGACNGEKVVLDASMEVSGWRKPKQEELERMPDEAKGHVVVADLPLSKYGEIPALKPYGYGRPGGLMVDLAADGELLTHARHPNSGFAFVEEGSTNGVFKATFEDLSGWEKESDVFATGYWWNFWSDRTVPVAEIDSATGEIALIEGEPRRSVNKPRHRIKKGGAVFLTNSLRALDRPGEWFFDRKERKVFVWPNKEKIDRWTIGLFDKPLFLLRNTRFVVLHDLVIEGGSANAVEMDGVDNVMVQRCLIRNFSRKGIACAGEDVRIEQCKLHGLGRGAIHLHGGNRAELVHSGNIVIGCEAWDLGRHWRTYSPAVHATGCGIDIVGNTFHDMPSSAIRADANDVRVISNNVYRCVLESDDQGAFDIYANPTFAGVEIMYNTWRDIGGGDIAKTGQAAVRLDDIVSGVVIRNNHFINCSRGIFGAVQINGGRRNFIDGNIFENCKLDVSVQSRSDKRWNAELEKFAWTFASPIYQSKYPGFKDLPAASAANYIWRSVLINVNRSCRPRH